MVRDDLPQVPVDDQSAPASPADEHAAGSPLRSDITRILSDIDPSDGRAAEQLLPLVYDELRKLAAAKMAQEKPGQTLQATALVHEAYLRLVDTTAPQRWDGRRHFFAAAAEAMRRILVENARRKDRPKHGGDKERVGLDSITSPVSPPCHDVLALDEALAKLARLDQVSAELVTMRYFVGLSIPQIAELLGLSPRTVDRRWAYARAWLRQELYAD